MENNKNSKKDSKNSNNTHRKKEYKNSDKKDDNKKSYRKKEYNSDEKDDNKKSYHKKEYNDKKDKEKREVTGFDPFLSSLSKKYKIECFVCKEEAMVAFEPIEGVPAICDRCHTDLEAKRLIYDEKKYFKTIIKNRCKFCEKEFYASNDTFIFCDECYNSFARRIQFAKRGISEFICEECGEMGYLYDKILKIREQNGEKKLCKNCFNKQPKQPKKTKGRRLSIRNKKDSN